jgi:hypothetical protein
VGKSLRRADDHQKVEEKKRSASHRVRLLSLILILFITGRLRGAGKGQCGNGDNGEMTDLRTMTTSCSCLVIQVSDDFMGSVRDQGG